MTKMSELFRYSPQALEIFQSCGCYSGVLNDNTGLGCMADSVEDIMSCSSGLSMCESRKPQETAFYKIVQKNLRQWLAMVNAADDGWSGVPKHVEQAFDVMCYPRSDSPEHIVLIASILTLSRFRAKKGASVPVAVSNTCHCQRTGLCR